MLDYANIYRNSSVQLYASQMQLNVDSDAAFLVLPKACSQIAGYFQLLDPLSQKNKHMHNGIILIEYRAIHSVVSSTVETETRGVFHNA